MKRKVKLTIAIVTAAVLGGTAVSAPDKYTTFTADKAGTPNCGHTCHVAVKAKDYVFHPYQTR